ncbi:retrotransposon hot spot (RHS) protein [Trypanosoma conorhini]|uniref:Retrotransposon hot spot (RHS) protein n=1 Tax=Trypanosoma conorhini TaxID=83891 RepID=A0A3R7R8V8_9TRYP|nr:retrotransposon hot spot (RHS) protein [Trypanosoma conorhini]RNE97987.1 retrotransposon hot spot (RHS) protein [Trypanosoma conorhini]
MNVGSYLLHQLLHCDAAKPGAVVHCFGGELAYVFDKTTQTVTEHAGAMNIIAATGDLARRGVKGYVIYDAAEEGAPPSSELRPAAWGMAVVAPSNESGFSAWAGTVSARRIIMNCPDENDVKAMCAWRTRDRPAQEQAEYWETAKARMHFAGPRPRDIFSEGDWKERTAAVDGAVRVTDAPVAEDACAREGEKLWWAGIRFRGLWGVRGRVRPAFWRSFAQLRRAASSGKSYWAVWRRS